jgi:hypothetical protein
MALLFRYSGFDDYYGYLIYLYRMMKMRRKRMKMMTMMMTWELMTWVLVMMRMRMTRIKRLLNQDLSPDPEALHLVPPVHHDHHQGHQGHLGPVQALDQGPDPVVIGEDGLGQGNG